MSTVVAVVGLGYVGLPQAVEFGKLVPGGCVLDVKGVLDHDAMRRAGHTCWRL